jgi:hypothetical protein
VVKVKTLMSILTVSLLFWAPVTAAEKVIPDTEAFPYAGESVAVKGMIANVFQSNTRPLMLLALAGSEEVRVSALCDALAMKP